MVAAAVVGLVVVVVVGTVLVVAVVVGSGYRTVGRPSRASVASSRSPEPEPPGSSFFFSRVPLRIISSSRSPSTRRHRAQDHH